MNDDFSAIATEKLLRLFPELSQFIINFNDVTDELARENDDTRVGMFVCTLGGKYYYIPIVGKGNVVQSIDSLFDPETQEFLPITKQIVQQLINTQSESMGKGVKIPSTVVQNPSVHSLVVPPRTGKIGYAGSSRVVELLAASPDMVKKAFLEQIKTDRPFAETLNKHFDLADIFKALEEKLAAPAVTEKDQDLQMLTGGENLSECEVQSILDKGYAMRGIQKEVRVAVPANDYSHMGKLSQLGGADAGFSYDISMKNGESRDGVILEQAREVPLQAVTRAAIMNIGGSGRNNSLVLFSNGDYSVQTTCVAIGEKRPVQDTLSKLFGYSTPITASSVANGAKVLILNNDMKTLAALTVFKVEVNSLGVAVEGINIITNEIVKVYAYRNAQRINAISSKEIFVPFNTTFISLRNDVSDDVERNINSAQAKVELKTLVTLGAMGTIGFDGVDFAYNGKTVGPLTNMIKVLVLDEHIRPNQAEAFVKQAQENRMCSFYMSKKADYAPAEIPQYGNPVADDQDQYQFGSGFTANVQQAAATGDSQVLEATLLSELVQAPDMKIYIDEYLPEIKAGMDKLGRILFLIKVNMSKMFNGENAPEVFNLVGNLRNVYRLLGDNYLKLERLLQDDSASELQEQAV